MVIELQLSFFCKFFTLHIAYSHNFFQMNKKFLCQIQRNPKFEVLLSRSTNAYQDNPDPLTLTTVAKALQRYLIYLIQARIVETVM